MDFNLIKNDYISGVTIPELSRRYSISPARIRYRARKENWRGEGAIGPLREAVFSTARLLHSISKNGEDSVLAGTKVDPRDLKYLTAAEKELLEVIRSIDGEGSSAPMKENDLLISAPDSSGVIFIPSVLSGEA